jgi:hypothetical protein
MLSDKKSTDALKEHTISNFRVKGKKSTEEHTASIIRAEE